MSAHTSNHHEPEKERDISDSPHQGDHLAHLATPQSNALRQVNAELLRKIYQTKESVDTKMSAIARPATSDYPLTALKSHIQNVVRSAFDDHTLEVSITPGVRGGPAAADLVVRVHELGKRVGHTQYVEVCVPKMLNAIEADPGCSAAVEKIEAKGVYLNLTLSKEFCAQALSSVLKHGEAFGRTNVLCGTRVVFDYSSPNAAKTLHAGHIRSTIIGHVLANIHEGAGATVYRINHINDLGGFGYLLEGYRRWGHLFDPELSQNDKLISLYAVRRACERISDHLANSAQIAPSDWEIANRFLGPLATDSDFVKKYADYCAGSEAAMEGLENGDPREVALWQQMVDWSLADFERFYDALDIHLDFLIGESFYIECGNSVVDQAIATGKAVIWDQHEAQLEREAIGELLVRGEISEADYTAMLQGIDRDIGAVVVPLTNHERLVVRRSDGRSIYATRDLGALAARQDIFCPAGAYYVVGQEQQDHFQKVFEAARLLELIPNDSHLEHIYFGFYVDAVDKKKLSSRAGASNVHNLLSETVKHFEKRYEAYGEMSDAERASIARTLAIGSLIFNDLKRDMKAPIELESGNVSRTLHDFEKSGGPYVVYAACRARSVVQKSNRSLPPGESINLSEFNDLEVQLALKLQQLPERVLEAASSNKPAVLLRYLVETATLFNGYYTKYNAIENGVVHEHRLILMASVQQVLENGLRICNVRCPDRI